MHCLNFEEAHYANAFENMIKDLGIRYWEAARPSLPLLSSEKNPERSTATKERDISLGKFLDEALGGERRSPSPDPMLPNAVISEADDQGE